MFRPFAARQKCHEYQRKYIFSLYFQSTDGVHVQHLKRSYPELREATSENDVLDSVYETSTNVSTVINNQNSQSVVSAVGSAALMKGLLWQQRDKLFSRWKERFFILTSDYLQCFKRGNSRITEMGAFIFKIKLSEVRALSFVLSFSMSRIDEIKPTRPLKEKKCNHYSIEWAPNISPIAH